ncbi:MAG: SMI1/KNR4 family protein [Lachnospiraceae bacterium]|nr:SMI1/KNR4 family protein [Lachnospiraceae bacterium]
MKYYKKSKKIMDMDATEFIGGVSKNEIKNAMKSLSVDFPKSYKAFLADFGGGDIGGEIIFGITGNKEDDVVIVTQMERNQGLPKNLVIIGFWNDTLVCLDTGKMNNGECPVIEVDDDYSQMEVIADTFGRLLYDYLEEE